jgi:conjugal transfer pilus assembly protein TraV
MKALVWVAVGCVSLTGCSLNPYHSEFMCAASADHGKCETVEQAYAEALAGKSSKANPSKSSESQSARPGGAGGKKDPKADGELVKTSLAPSAEDRYREAQYRKLAALIEEPVTPIVQQAKVLRTLILSYPASETLYMPRHIFYFAEQPKFVIGEYLNPESTPKTLYPNGAP